MSKCKASDSLFREPKKNNSLTDFVYYQSESLKEIPKIIRTNVMAVMIRLSPMARVVSRAR